MHRTQLYKKWIKMVKSRLEHHELLYERTVFTDNLAFWRLQFPKIRVSILKRIMCVLFNEVFRCLQNDHSVVLKQKCVDS